MKILSAIQEIIINKSIDDIVYEDGLVFKRHKSDLSKKINIDYWSLILPPKPNSSNQTQKELSIVIDSANNRSKSDINLVFDVDDDPLNLYNTIIKKYNLIFPYQKFSQLYIFLYSIVTDLKYFYNRARPYQLANFYRKPINIIQTNSHQTPSYPSGHTAYAALATKVLTEAYPEHSKHFEDILDICAKARVIQGVHYPSDNAASIMLVNKVYNKLEQFNKNF